MRTRVLQTIGAAVAVLALMAFAHVIRSDDSRVAVASGDLRTVNSLVDNRIPADGDADDDSAALDAQQEEQDEQQQLDDEQAQQQAEAVQQQADLDSQQAAEEQNEEAQQQANQDIYQAEQSDPQLIENAQSSG